MSEETSGSSIFTSIFRAVVIYFVLGRLFQPKQQPATTTPSTTIPVIQKYGIQYTDPKYRHEMSGIVPNPFQGLTQGKHDNLFPVQSLIDIEIYLTTTERYELTEFPTLTELIWKKQNLYYSMETNEYQEIELDLNITIPGNMATNNETLYAHVYVTQHGISPNPMDGTYDPLKVVSETIPMLIYLPKLYQPKLKHLLEEETSIENDEIDEETYVTYWKPELRINPIVDHTKFTPTHNTLPFVGAYLKVDIETGNYYPIVFLNEFWVLRKNLIQVNATTETVPLKLYYNPIGLTKFTFYIQMDKGFTAQKEMKTTSMSDIDGIKQILLESNPYLLAVTMMMSILHSIFDFLAFKNDISFWKNKQKQKQLEGISLRSVCINTFFQLVIFLYLVDNQTDTSYMILFSSFIGLMIEFWKLYKVYSLQQKKVQPEKTCTDLADPITDTNHYDQYAVRHLTYLMIPLVLGYSFYTLHHREHKSWYSWVLSSLVGFVYAFGFILMTPQLYINYKLKSVAHLPWKTMVYKSLNTFIDDLFAFVIHMPVMHRIACFRDDLIFFIFLYQKWIYPVDKSRINEYGQQEESDKKNQ